MTHIEEHILELYLLHAPEVKSREREIAAHLAECAGCSARAKEIGGFHADLKIELESAVPEPEATGQAVEKFRSPLPTLSQPVTPSRYSGYLRPISSFRYFIRRHPLVAGAGAFTSLACVAALVMMFLKQAEIRQPAYYEYDTSSESFNVRDAKHQFLWSLLGYALEDPLEDEHTKFTNQTEIVDINGDGINEVLTTIQLNEDVAGNKKFLRVFNADGSLRWNGDAPRPTKWQGRSYLPSYHATSLLTLENPLGRDIFVALNNDRSPSILCRYNSNGEVVGEYWHFGAISGIYRIRDEGKTLLAIGGIDDDNDTTYNQYPFVAILDPTKIIGRTSSTHCVGFGIQSSQAEVYYFKFSLCDMNKALKTNQSVHHINVLDGRIQSVTTMSGLTENGHQPVFDYFFDETLNVLEAKTNNSTDRLRDSLISRKKIIAVPYTAYLKSRKQDICYWDGMQWHKSPVKIKHDLNWANP